MGSVDADEDAATGRLADVGAEPEERQLRGRLRARLFGDALEPVKIGRFIIIERIGKGGLGVVYSAYDPQLDRRVAVKLIAPSFRNDDEAAAMHARLHREARAMAKVSHPSVVTIFEVGDHEGGIFVAMELVEGMSLRAWWQQAGDDWARKRDLLVGAARGLAAAHDKSIVHRDFKPSNVLVAGEVARVLDFGLARGSEVEAPTPMPTPHPSGGEGPGLSVITDAGTVLGTPAFMAPEQATGGAVDPRSDQFTFCLVAWEALFGHRPFGGDDLDARLAAIGRGPPPVPTRLAGVPVWLVDALRKGMALQPERRHASMDALIHAMTRDLRSRRRQRIALVAAAVGSAVVAGGLAWWFRPGPPVDPADEVDVLVAQAHEAAAKSHYVYPPSDAPEEPTAYSTVLALEGLGGDQDGLGDERAAQLRAEFSDTMVRLGDEYWDRDGGRPFSIDYYAAALMFEPGNRRAKERASLTLGELVALRAKAASRDFTESELDAAETLHALAAPTPEVRSERLAKRKRVSASSAAKLAQLAGATPKASAPTKVAVATPAAKADPQVPPEVDDDLQIVEEPDAPAPAPAAHSSKSQRKQAAEQVAAGRTAFRSGNYDRASQHYHRALELDAGSHGAQAGLGELAFDRGKYQEAVRHFERAVKLSPKRAGYWLQLGDANLKVVQYEAARAAYKKAKALGDGRADARLEKLDQRTGHG
jgi:tetratricopeptide (TPR) repeat protein